MRTDLECLPARPAVFLDFDGCLVDLAPTPDAARVPRGLPPLLHRVHRLADGALALVSGRPVAQLRAFLPGLHCIMVGSHGAERWDGQGAVARAAVNPATLAHVKARAAEIIGTTQGLIFEDKPVAVGLHYRGAPQHFDRLQGEAEALVAGSPGFHLHHGKMVMELRPDGIGKGQAVAALLRSEPFRGRSPVMMGDDATDEPAFAIANAHGGVSVKVGPGPTCATRRVGSPAQVRRLLTTLASRLEAR